MNNLFVKTLYKLYSVDCVREYRFHPTRRWRIDYAIPAHKIAIEVEGGIYTHGRHTRGKGYKADMEKYNSMMVRGWRLVRVTPSELMTLNTFNIIKSLIDGNTTGQQ